MTYSRGYTLVELIVAVGLFALVMTLASGAYLMMTATNRQVQGLSLGVDNLSFALETMARNIRTGTGYTCPTGTTNCVIDGTTNSFSFTNENAQAASYDVNNATIQQTIGGVQSALTDPAVAISTLTFSVTGAKPVSAGDYTQPYVTIVVAGTVNYGKGKTEPFTIETGATMRGSDL